MMGGIIPFWCARSSRFGGRLGSESARLASYTIEHPVSKTALPDPRSSEV
jgi:hypothetical protein